MQAISPLSPANQSMSISKGLQSIAVAGFFTVVEKVMRVAAYLLSCCGVNTTALSRQANKIHVMYVLNNMANFCISPLPRYTFAKNLCHRDAVSKEQDAEATKAMRERFLAAHKDPEVVNKVQNMKIKGAKRGGVCFGATLFFIKAYYALKDKNFESLKNLANQFQEGFGAEAFALQRLHGKTVGWYPELSEKQIQEVTCLLDEELKSIQNELAVKQKVLKQQAARLNKDTLVQKIEAFEKEFHERCKTTDSRIRKAKLIQHVSENYGALARLVNLELKSHMELPEFDTDDAKQKQFENLPEGIYQLLFNTKTCGHAVVYLKSSFGNFLFDPNFGLMPVDEPQALKKLLTSYPINRARNMRLNSYAVES